MGALFVGGSTVVVTDGGWLTKDAAGFFTSALFIVGILQLALFYWQLRLMRSGADDAAAAARAAQTSAEVAGKQSIVAQETLKTMQDTAQRQLRAYIGIFAMEVRVQPFEGGGSAFIAHAELRNFGQTPAYDVLIQSNAAVEVPDAMPFSDAQGPAAASGSAIAFRDAGLHVNQGWQISSEDAEAIRNRTKIVFLWGSVKYKDAFRSEHFFNFRLISGHQVIDHPGIYVLGPHPLGYESDY